MNFPSPPDHWMDVLQNVIVVAGAIVLAGIPAMAQSVRNHRGIKQIEAKTDAIGQSVINGHASQPLRADLDKVISEVGKVRAAVERVSEAVAEMRDDAAHEKATRRAEIRELREDVDGRLNTLNRRFKD